MPASPTGRLAAFLILIGVALPAGAAPPTLAQAAAVFGIPAADVARLANGEVVTRALEPAAPTELGVALAVLVRRPMSDVQGFIASDAWFEQDREIVAHGDVDPEAALASLDGVAFASADEDEIKRLLQAKEGDALNLATAERARLREAAAQLGTPSPWKQPSAAAVTSQAYRAILAGRIEAYAAKGVGGIAPYDRGADETTDPAVQLEITQDATPLLAEVAPGLAKALREFPAGQPTQRWLWLRQIAQDRPTYVLSHRMIVSGEGSVFAAERQYFVGHSWNAALVLGGLVETDAGTLLVYSNRMHVDAVAGAMGGMKRSIGRGMMEKSVRSFFESVKRNAEKRQ